MEGNVSLADLRFICRLFNSTSWPFLPARVGQELQGHDELAIFLSRKIVLSSLSEHQLAAEIQTKVSFARMVQEFSDALLMFPLDHAERLCSRLQIDVRSLLRVGLSF